MIDQYKKNAKLVLSNGVIFPGFSFGAIGTAVGEIVFNTGMTGYQEVITDQVLWSNINIHLSRNWQYGFNLEIPNLVTLLKE